MTNAPTITLVPVFDYIVFGGTSDLALRKLLPALFARECDGQLPRAARIFSLGRSTMTIEQYRDDIRLRLGEAASKTSEGSASLDRFLSRLFYGPIDAKTDLGWQALADQLNSAADRIRVFYMSVGSTLYADFAANISRYQLNTPQSRIVLEKPIGSDSDTATIINDTVAKYFSESQIYRIDHYLGKETVQNLFMLRFANALFEPIWNRDHIDHVQITAAETVGLETRAAYYDTAGAFRDMVQNHLLQLVCLIAMEPPARYEADAIRDEKLKVLRSLKALGGDEFVRGQYGTGLNSQVPLTSYAQDLGASSNTETFIALRVGIENWRWADVPFYLRTGKRLPAKVTEITIAFRSVPHLSLPFPASSLQSNKLTIRLQPDEGMTLGLNIKKPGSGGFHAVPVQLDMSYAESFGGQQAEAYERLLMDVIKGSQTLFMRRDEVDAAWRWATPAMMGWKNKAPSPYAAGSWGPDDADILLTRDGRAWNN